MGAPTQLEHAWAAEALFRLADWTNSTGEAYFRSLVRGLADVLGVRWVYISRLHPELPNHAQVIAGWSDGEPAAGISYDLAGTPCARVLTGAPCFYPAGVAEQFPHDRMLTDLGVVSYAGAPLRGDDGTAYGLLTVMHDQPLDSLRSPCAVLSLIAGRAAAELERIRVETELRRREEQVRILTESTPAMLWSATAEGAAEYLSFRAAEYCGVPVESMLGENFLTFIHADDVQVTWQAFQHALATGRPYESEFRLRRADGAYRWHLARAVASRDRNGKILRWHGSLVDVDDRRRAEEALKDLDRRKDEFLAILAHELRNPLAPIRHALEVQARSGDDIAAWSEMRDTMERQVTHLVRLVDDLLDVSRLTTGHITLRCRTIDVRDVVIEALASCRDMLAGRQQRVTTQLSSTPLLVDGDHTRLVQILTNIVNNAARFTPEGGEIDIAADELDGAVEIRVRDSGAGIPAEVLPRIFALFSQSARGDERDHGGLGVGLTLARWLAELHGGTVMASSEGPDRGSEFVIRLPMTASHQPADHEALPATRVEPDLPALHVLIVDDYVDATRALDRLLRVLGHTVSIAHDGKTGIELAHRLQPDVILLDIGLPEMNGYSVAKQLRSLGVSTRIVALTGYGADLDRERVRDAGIDAHLVKPVDAHDLVSAMHGVVKVSG